MRFNGRITHPIGIAYDEWNVWYRARDAASRLEECYDLSDALAVATYLNVFIRRCQSVQIANLAQLVNVIAPMVTGRDGLFLQTIYHPLRLYAEHTQDLALDVWVDCPTRALPPEPGSAGRPTRVADLGPFKLLDVAATRDAGGRSVTLTVVNRDRNNAIPANVVLADGASVRSVRVSEVNGPTVDAVNSFEQPNAVDVVERDLSVRGSTFTYSFPAHSVTVLRLGLGGT